uniref:Trichome birefringence-like C-terminal domain-containing protein n=1 Tax=Odontella aurita TaxID=265563 RepID=A0A7S4M8K7_9STRA|mmetsp:Transcript_14115/g.41411  ORF Transcript_14115/g.41411 Transcript_14115/m.41411 type:complete len:439 (+) Transcript_14115:72-1388(+)
MKVLGIKAKAGATLMIGAGALLFLYSEESFNDGNGSALPTRTLVGGTSCSSRRGADLGSGGRWEKNPQAGPLMQYGLPWSPVVMGRGTLVKADELHLEGWATDPSNHLPSLRSTKYRDPSTYVWRDDPSTEEECGPMVPLNGDAFCDTTIRLGIGKVMFLGDSLSKYHSVALMNQIRASEGATSMPDNGGYYASHTCSGRHTVKIVFITNKLLMEKSSPAVPDTMKHTWDPLPWKEEYMSGALSGGGTDSSLRTLLIVNTGAHHGKFKDYTYVNKAIDDFLSDVKTKFHRPKDIVVLRTTPPGHPACEKMDHPFENEAEREEFITSLTKDDTPEAQEWKKKLKLYQWDKYEKMNEHLREAVRMYNKDDSHSGPSNVHLLDVSHMTNLRPDGHMGGIDNKNPNKKVDCLHYSLPGPIDWWSNLLFANLADLPTHITRLR